MTPSVSRTEAVAFRLAAHHLTERLAAEDLLRAAAACGVQNSPPGSALLALHARVEDVTRERMDDAVGKDKSLLQTWSLRGAPFFFPTADAAVFTAGVLPATEAALRHFVVGVQQSVDRLGLSLTEAVGLTRDALRVVLTGRRLAIEELGRLLADRVADALTDAQREVWRAEGQHAAGQPVGEAVVHFCLRILTVEGLLCFAPRVGNTAPFVLVEQWLGDAIPAVDPEQARAELVRRYLRCYGPATRAGFAGWVGVRVGDVDPWWTPIQDELTPVSFGGRSWVLTDELEALRSTRMPEGLRLLPPSDPYLQLRDRDTILDARHHRELWRAVGAPGAVLADGEVVGTWRPRKTGAKLTLTIRAFTALAPRHERALRAEAEHVAALRGASSVEIA